MGYNISDKLFGSRPKKPDTKKYDNANDEILKDIEGYIPEEYQNLSPEELAQLGPSAMEGVSTDPALKAAQMAALKRMQEVSEKGYTVEEEAAIGRMRRDNAQADRGRREAILQNRAARGMGGSGDELAAALSSSQAANEGDNAAALNTAAMAQRRALAAMQESGNMAGRMRGQEFTEKSDIARARDAVNQFNTQNSVRAQFQNNTGVNQFNQNKFENNARVGEIKYNDNTNKANRDMEDWAQKDARRRAKAGAIMGMAGAGAGAYFGGPAGAQAGQSIGSSAGSFMAHGGEVQGEEIVPHDSIINDVVPVQVSAGEVVIPKSLAQNPKHAAIFTAVTTAEDEEDLITKILSI